MENLDLSNLSISDTDKQDTQAAVKKFPSDVRKWMKANATPKMALKLMQVCKYFQHQKFPYFVVKDFTAWGDVFQFRDLKDVFDKGDPFEDVPSRLWIADTICFFSNVGEHFIPQILTKISVFEAKKLYFVADEIFFDDFKALTSSGTIIYLHCAQSYIRDESGKIAPFEEILDCLPNIEEIYFREGAPSFSSQEAAKKEWIPSNLMMVEFQDVDEDFDVASFIEFMKKQKHIKFIISFLDPPCFDCNVQLQAFIDEVVQAADLRYPPPRVELYEQTSESRKAMAALENAFYENEYF